MVMFSAGLLWLLAFYEPQGNQPAFRLDVVRQITGGATNVVVFRLISVDSKRKYWLLTPGTISPPLPSIYGPFTLSPSPPAVWATNFIPITFRNQVEFAIVAPTNEVWKLNTLISHPLSRMETFTWKTEMAWDRLKRRQFSAIPGSWAGPWSVTLNYYTWSAPLTNKPGVNNEMTHSVP